MKYFPFFSQSKLQTPGTDSVIDRTFKEYQLHLWPWYTVHLWRYPGGEGVNASRGKEGGEVWDGSQWPLSQVAKITTQRLSQISELPVSADDAPLSVHGF